VVKFPDIGAWWDRVLLGARKRWNLADHSWRAGERFGEVHGGQLAAAISYYAFFAAFSMSLLALAIFGYLLNLPQVYNSVESWLETNLPVIDVGVLESSRQSVTIFAAIALVVAGVAWVQSVRAAIRTIWSLDAQPGNPFLRWAIDFLILIGVSALVLITIGATAGAEWALASLDLDNATGYLALGVRAISVLVGLIANALLAMVLLQALPRVVMPLRRVVWASVSVSIGTEMLKTVGRIYVLAVSDRPAYQAVTTAVGLLVFLYLFNVMLLLAASWTATSLRGRAIDLYGRVSIPYESGRLYRSEEDGRSLPLSRIGHHQAMNMSDDLDSSPTMPSDVTPHVGFFDRFATKISEFVARAGFFMICVLLIFIWAPSIIFLEMETWQLIINTATTIITFLMVALLQNTQTRHDAALQHKLNAIADALSDIMDQLPGDTAQLHEQRRELRDAVGLEDRESA
jgi:membrane protein